jgi:hypothetical protein
MRAFADSLASFDLLHSEDQSPPSLGVAVDGVLFRMERSSVMKL